MRRGPRQRTTEHDIFLERFYDSVGREVSLARQSQYETHNWVVVLVAAGVGVTASLLLAEADDGEALRFAYLLVLFLMPLVFRLFVRSCLEYQIFHRWIEIRRALDYLFFAKKWHPALTERASDYARNTICLYYFEWRQPRSNWKMVYDNIRLAYGWPLLVTVFLQMYLAFAVSFDFLLKAATLLVVLWMTLEVVWFVKYFHRRHAEVPEDAVLKADELCKAE